MAKKWKVTLESLHRLAGIFSILAGALYICIQFIHPAEQLSSVQTTLWVLVAFMTIVMSVFSLIGILGIYLRQVVESGWLGLVGFVAFSLFWLISMTFSFIEAFVLPLLTNESPMFVAGMVGLFGETKSEFELGVFPILAPVAGVLYLVGGLLLGIATFRARVFPRMAGALLAFAAVVTLGAAVIPHPFDRVLAVPMGVAFIWMGYLLWVERSAR